MKNTKKTERFTNVFKILLTVLPWFLIPAFTLPMSFMTNDDTGIQAALNGSVTGEPYPYHLFINSILGHFLSGLYRLSSEIEWWYLWSLLCMGIGIYLIHRSFCKASERKGEIIAAICVMGFGFWIFAVSNVSFTVVPCILMTGATCTMFVRDSERWDWRYVAACGCTLLITSWHRIDTAEVMLCYFAMGLLWYAVQCRNLTIKKKVIYYIGALLGTVGLILASQAMDAGVKEQNNSEYFREFNKTRIQYMDYFQGEWDENEEIFQQYGWNENLYDLVKGWCFLDNRVNAETMQGIMEAEIEDGGEKENNSRGVRIIGGLIGTDSYAMILTLMALVFAMAEISMIRWKLGKSIYNFFYLSNIMGTVLLILFLGVRGRMPLRAYMILILPMVCISILLLLKMGRLTGKSNGQLLILGIAVSVFALFYSYDSENIAGKQENNRRTEIINDYLEENSENIYIYNLSVYDNRNPLLPTKGNLLFWGGSSFYSELYYESLAYVGLDELSMETFENDNVYFLDAYVDKTEVSGTAERLFNCLTDYGAVAMERVDDIDKLGSVYRFKFDDSLKSYTGSYSTDGNTYYYEDGKRRTGWFLEDDKIYYAGMGSIMELDGKYITTYGGIEEHNKGECEITGEYYEDHWMGKEMELSVWEDMGAKVCMDVIVTGENVPNTISVYSGEKLVESCELECGENQIVFELPECGLNQIRISADRTFRPDNGDARELSVVVSSISIEN